MSICIMGAVNWAEVGCYNNTENIHIQEESNCKFKECSTGIFSGWDFEEFPSIFLVFPLQHEKS